MVGQRHLWWWAMLFLLPAVILTLVFFYYPMGYIVWLSTHHWNGLSTIKPFSGFSEYTHLFQESIFGQVIRNTVIFVVGTVIPSIVIGLGLALLVNRPLPFRSLLRGISFAPYLVSFVSAGLAWVWMGSSNGLFNHLLGFLGLHPGNLVSNPTYAMPYVIAMYTWKMAGYNMVLYLAGLQTIPREIYEAGAIDGLKDGWTQFRMITWPLLRETTFFVIIINLIFSFRAFSAIYVMTGGGPIHATTTLVYYIWRLAFVHNSWGQAAAASTLLLVIVLLLTVGMVRYFTTDATPH
ncbi:carbohydrate ABC transporter permease [Sulfobacillus thermosulfidooxidans]|uniref:carbohydrate ABC transporter permease n=1 Tax=Sulfobacillus thermosulfidooxidans TaxID=28034 RepID=UPI0006B5ED26|nr:sugar ABC transporter permease [Sulfobacillus thermosulfidooxidans]